MFSGATPVATLPLPRSQFSRLVTPQIGADSTSTPNLVRLSCIIIVFHEFRPRVFGDV